MPTKRRPISRYLADKADAPMPLWARAWLIFGDVPTDPHEKSEYIRANYLFKHYHGGREPLVDWWKKHRAELLAEAKAAKVRAHGLLMIDGV